MPTTNPNIRRGFTGTDIRNDSGRYTWRDGDYVAVSKVLGVIAKPALITWAASEVAKYVVRQVQAYDAGRLDIDQMIQLLRDERTMKGAPYEKRDDKAVLGSTVHDVAEQYGKFGEVDLNTIEATARTYARSLVAWFDRYQPEIERVETTVFSRKLAYAGTLDCIFKIGNRRFLGDFKTSADTWPEHQLQLAAYKYADFLAVDANTWQEEEMLRVDECCILNVQPDGVKMRIWPTTENEFKAFAHFKRGWEWQNKRPGYKTVNSFSFVEGS